METFQLVSVDRFRLASNRDRTLERPQRGGLLKPFRWDVVLHLEFNKRMKQDDMRVGVHVKYQVSQYRGSKIGEWWNREREW